MKLSEAIFKGSSEFDSAEVSLQQSKCEQQLLKNLNYLAIKNYKRDQKQIGLLHEEDLFNQSEIKARESAINKLMYQSEVNLALA